MKRFFVVMLIMLYGITSSGMLLNLHFCDNNLSEVSLANNEEPDCCCAGDVEKDNNSFNSDCCSNTTVSAKINVDQSFPELENYLVKHVAEIWDIPVFSLWQQDLDQGTSNTKTAINRSQHRGRWQNIPLYKISCSFIYYG